MTVDDVALAAAPFRPAGGTFIIGVTGSVASGKSTFAKALAETLGGARVELVSTDGFLLPNTVLAEHGLELRKGFPETYDLTALAGALRDVRHGPATFPAYSHITYDLDPVGGRPLKAPDALIVEGLALGFERPAPPPPLIDCLIYLDAREADLEAWFTTRFMALWEAAADDPTSFYRRFRSLDREGAEKVAHAVWTGINLPNLREHIAPVRAHADLVVIKGPDHGIVDIVTQSAALRP